MASRWARRGPPSHHAVAAPCLAASRPQRWRARSCQEIGAKTIDLEWVQVHPTGLVKPDDADAKIKFLAAEAMHTSF